MRLLIMICLGVFPAMVAQASARDDVMALIAGHHPVAPAVLKSLDDEQLKALRDVARDTSVRVFTRGRAIALLGVRPDATTEALWREARVWPELDLQIQAAYAQAMARSRDLERLKAFLLTLMADAEPRIREVGIQCIFAMRIPEAKSMAKVHLATEKDVVNRAILQRRLDEMGL